jgi:ubiquinone/menaquinone biosynthesis C-methylase UbiE
MNPAPLGTAVPHATDTKPGHDWRQAGEAWGRSPVDWACLYEHYSIEVIGAIFARTGVDSGVSVLDVACGAGLAVRVARGNGAAVAGIDASEPLLAIARERNPEADLRLGSMFELPWPDGSFDVAISINGIWGDCEGALREMHRVVRPGGRVGISFWGNGTPLDSRAFFLALSEHMPDTKVDGMRSTNRIARPGTAETMLVDAGFRVIERGSRVSTIEWADADLAWRALSSTGPVVPALEHGDADRVRRDALAAIEHCRAPSGIYRFQNDHQFVIAEVPT